VLAPPTATVVPATPASRAAVKANNAWLTAHWEAYRGHWIALRAGHFADENPRMTLTLPDGQPFATGATS
jgi:hypothetical protein